MNCPKCKLPIAQQLLTSLLCINHFCTNYDKPYHEDYIKQKVSDEFKKKSYSLSGRIIVKDIKVTINNQIANITIPLAL